MIVVAKRLPEARFILLDETETWDPLGAFPEVEMGHQQACWATMLGCQRLSLVGVDHPGLAVQYFFQGQIGGIAPMQKAIT